jgi:hypothetical protein
MAFATRKAVLRAAAIADNAGTLGCHYPCRQTFD